ncbi:AraC family transcriptional regulator [Streptomyces bingchenggensis BCW-1]|uniref:AraC family transcriptional regulator n=1 Tax=Streptomyces bingchenggensis (strain BCW-1) TaxID=749414 RepID=D7C0I9_STRBB|nr:helix-turn-helix domain-containing protein [Streptomyces milbemycinicus]ADI03680.1 AraC family transcriptional regulator [Streptomyces bingchenggensis BCW-1]
MADEDLLTDPVLPVRWVRLVTARPVPAQALGYPGVALTPDQAVLHTLFRRQEETVAASIRRRRLERCHADLTDPRLRRRSISAIAARWGFVRPADFSRAFRAAYGVAPRELRQAALRNPPDTRQAAPGDK